MGTGDNSDFTTDDVDEAIDELNVITPAPVAEAEAQPIWARRTILKAAALGTAAAALVSKGPGGLRLGPLPAAADDLSTFQCTANDVRIIGTGQIINEPCNCSGTFNATVQFTVENNAASDRSCITLHLVPGTLPDGTTFTPGDILLQGTIAGKTTAVMTGTIQNYPCGAGLVCFGAPVEDGRRRCDAGQCSTVSWAVPGQDNCPPDRQISSKCRHQRICIQGRGSTTLDCDTSVNGVQTTCEVDCGGSTTLRLCTSGGPAPYTFVLNGQTKTSSNLCENFTVGPITADTTFTGTVTDADGCAKSATVTLTVTEIEPIISVDGDEDCEGVLTFSASAEGFEDCTAEWTIDGEDVDANADGTLTYQDLDGDCHTVGVKLTCGGCFGEAETSVSQCVETTVGCASGLTAGARTTTAQSGSGTAQKSKKQGKGAQRGKGKRKAPKRGKKGASKKRK